MKNYGIVRIRRNEEEDCYEFALMHDHYEDMQQAEISTSFSGEEIGDILVPIDLAYVCDVIHSHDIWIVTDVGFSKKTKDLKAIIASNAIFSDYGSWMNFWDQAEADDMLLVANYVNVDRFRLAKITYLLLRDLLSFEGVEIGDMKEALDAVSNLKSKYTSNEISKLIVIRQNLNLIKREFFLHDNTTRSINIILCILETVCYCGFDLSTAVVYASRIFDDKDQNSRTEARVALGRKLSKLLPLKEVLLASVK